MKRGKKATIRMGEVEIPAEIVSEPGMLPQDWGVLPRDFRTPPFYVEILGVLGRPINDPIVSNQLTDAVGLAAKHLHIAAHYNPQFHKAFVYKRGRYYVFECHRTGAQIAATLTVMSDNRVRVTYHNGKEPEILYL
jgi:hypothetical protein